MAGLPPAGRVCRAGLPILAFSIYSAPTGGALLTTAVRFAETPTKAQLHSAPLPLYKLFSAFASDRVQVVASLATCG